MLEIGLQVNILALKEDCTSANC